MKQTDITQLIQALKVVFATKDELLSMEKRQDIKRAVDLKAMETRQDKKYATKKELKAMEERQDKKYATKEDLIAMEHRQEKIFASKEDLAAAIRLLPTRKEFFACMDKLSREYTTIDQAETLHTGTLAEHTDQLESHHQRIKALEHRHGGNPVPVIP